MVIVCTSEQSFTIGGITSGLNGSVILQNNGKDNLTVTSNGSFEFTNSYEDSSTYSVTVLEQPETQNCSLANATGTIEGRSVSNITLSCSARQYTVGGTVSGLSGTLVLQNNAGDDLTITANGIFAFANTLSDSASYSVTVLNQPVGQNCTLSNATGTIDEASVNNANVSCVTNQYSVGGTVSGLNGTLVLQNNGGDNESITANGPFTFNTEIDHGDTYAVTILTLPTDQDCAITSGTGTAAANVSNIVVTCDDYKIIRVSTTTSGGNFGANTSLAIAAADALCVTDFGAGYKALLGSSIRNTTTDWPLSGNTTYVRPDDTVVGKTTSGGIFTFPLTAAISAIPAGVWTGLGSDWTVGNNCSDWTTTGGGGYNGYADDTSSGGILENGFGCSTGLKLICVEQ